MKRGMGGRPCTGLEGPARAFWEGMGMRLDPEGPQAGRAGKSSGWGGAAPAILSVNERSLSVILVRAGVLQLRIWMTGRPQRRAPEGKAL